MEKIILRRLELLINGAWTKEETLKNILELVEDYSKRFIIFADNTDTMALDELYNKFEKCQLETTDINGNSAEKE